MAELAPLPAAEPSEPPVVGGVPLRQYATVLAGLDDGLVIESLFALTGVEASTWDAAHEAWQERIIEDLEVDGTLAVELEEEKAEAMKLWIRPLPPFDEQLEPWLDFLRTWAHEPDGDGFLAEHGMRPADVVRLQRLWADRMAEDPDLQREALTILAAEPGPLVEVTPEPAQLDPETRLPPRAEPAGPPLLDADGGAE